MTKKILLTGILSLTLFGAGCGSSYTSEVTGKKTSDCSSLEPENPYSSGGRSAGFEWAERTGGSCNGNSAAFNEGCERFQQMDRDYANCLDKE